MALTDDLTVGLVTVPWVRGSCWPAIRPADPPSESESLFPCILLSTSDPLKSVWLSAIPNVRLLQQLEVLRDLLPEHEESLVTVRQLVLPEHAETFPLPVSTPRDASASILLAGRG